MYELWDVETGNAIATFDRRADALALVRELAEGNEPAYVGSLALGLEGAAGRTTLIAQGPALAALAAVPADRDAPLQIRQVDMWRRLRAGRPLGRPPR